MAITSRDELLMRMVLVYAQTDKFQVKEIHSNINIATERKEGKIYTESAEKLKKD